MAILIFGQKIGIDLGTKNTVIAVGRKGIVVNEPSVVTYDEDTYEIVSMGEKAAKMLEKNPETLKVIAPLSNGVISNLSVTEKMVYEYLKKICKYSIFKPSVMVCTPSSVTSLEKKTLLDAITAGGAGKACVMEEPLAAIVGAGVDINNPNGYIVCDIGGGTTDIAVVTMGNVSISKSLFNAGNAMDLAIQKYVKRERNIIIGISTAERIKKEIGCAYLPTEELEVEGKGKEYITGAPVSFNITSTEVYLALRETIERICEGIRQTLEATPPELVADIYTNGLILTGGGAKLYGFEKALKVKLGMKVKLANNPELCVAKGLDYALKHPKFLENNGYVFTTRENLKGYIE